MTFWPLAHILVLDANHNSVGLKLQACVRGHVNIQSTGDWAMSELAGARIFFGKILLLHVFGFCT
jgi:hypothetical protein